MKLSKSERQVFKCAVDFMQRIDPNGVYYTILEDLECANPEELIIEILKIFSRWKEDIHHPLNTKYRAISKFENELILILQNSQERK